MSNNYKTIHIKGRDHSVKYLRMLYEHFLKDDPLWHFVYWQDGWTHKAFIEGKNILIRCTSEKVIKDLQNYLEATGDDFEVYDFPFPRGKYQLGLKRLSWEARHLDISMSILHAFSMAHIKMSKKTYKEVIIHFNHIAFNIAGYDYAEEALVKVEMIYRPLNVVKKWYRKMSDELTKAKTTIDYYEEKTKKKGS